MVKNSLKNAKKLFYLLETTIDTRVTQQIKAKFFPGFTSLQNFLIGAL